MDSATTQTVERLSGNAGRRPAVQTFIQASPRDALDLLEQFGATVSVQRDQEIHGQGEEANSCYRILRGCVRMVKLMEDGRRQIGEFLMAGDLLGFDALETHDFAAEAVSDVVLRRYPRRMVDALAERNAPLARNTFLLEMAERLPQARAGVLDMPMSRTDMADHLGLTIETVCRILALLRRDATVAIERGTVEIRDYASLQQMASEQRH
jgi:CRP-like cAMP-binding protein